MTDNTPTKKQDLLSIPFCLFMGPQRSGTSWLYRYLMDRGDVCLPSGVKEVFFFDLNKGKTIFLKITNKLELLSILYSILLNNFQNTANVK